MKSSAEILAKREVIGWKLGLERMRRLCSLLGMPQHRFASIHVVGTNGKTSVARMTAALIEAHGACTGAYLSPHITSWNERVLIGGEPVGEEAFVSALERAEQAAEVADRSAGEEGPVTQFELLTAAAFVAFAEARVEFAVIEAGLGGRLDATNVIPSKVTVLTSVGLDHTEWLGETLEEIAAEKLAVLRDHTTLVTGELPPEVERVVEREVARRHATRRLGTSAAHSATGPGPGPRSTYQGKNVAVALETGYAAAPLDLGLIDALRAVFRTIPGRAEVVEASPPLIFDAAHNPDGARALAESLPNLLPLPPRWRRLLRRRRPTEIVCCLAILTEKDARAIVEALAPTVSHFVCTQIPEEAIRGSGRPVTDSHPASALAALCEEAGASAEAVEDPIDAWRRARELASERDGAALATGSHYLLSCIWTERPVQSS